MTNLRPFIEQQANALGFTSLGFHEIGQTPYLEHFTQWLEHGHHGEMAYLERGALVRQNPAIRLSEAKTAVVLAMPHHHQRPPDPGGRTGAVARYAWGRDYHNLISKRLKKLRARLREQGIDNWGGVDTAPILERAWAQAAGIGFSGKNCMQIIPASTSYFFLAVLFITESLEPTQPLGDHCGSCKRCLVGCPTQAFVGPRELDSRRCISYWTIEARGLAPRSLRPDFGRWIFGCDVCQEVCPHNVTPPPCDEDDFAPRHAWLDLDELLLTPDEPLHERFIGTPLRRPGPVGLKRNALIVLGNLKDPGAEAAILSTAHHEHPVVRAAAVWALQRLGCALPQHLSVDSDPLVQQEVQAVGDLRD
jgi:epoxyqueuosine reductase